MRAKTFRLTDAQIAWLESESQRLGLSEASVLKGLFPMDNEMAEQASELSQRLLEIEGAHEELEDRVSSIEERMNRGY